MATVIPRRFEELPPPRPELVAHYRAGPECSRSGCHRTATVRIRSMHLCGPCLNAAAAPLARTMGRARVEVL